MSDIIRDDFDRIAPYCDEGWNHNSHYHSFLLRQLAPKLSHALDLGCGIGTFSRLLALRSVHVLSLDLSPEMIRIARKRSADYPHIQYEVADVMNYPMPEVHFDCIASIATLHHLPLAAMLEKMKRALMPGGTILALDLFRQNLSLDALLYNGIAIPTSLMLKMAYTGQARHSPEARAAWEEHGKHDTYLSLGEVCQICNDLLPGANIRRHLLWRYSIVWTKPL